MPLKPGYSHQTVDYNISEMMRAGHTKAQSIAASHAKARVSYFQRFPFGALPAWLSFPRKFRLRDHYDKFGKPLRENPQVAQGARLIEEFSGHKAKVVGKIRIPDAPKTALAIGHVLGIIYETKRDGEIESYIHRFAKASRPLLATSHDGKQLLLIGGSYNFTDRGIVDIPR